MAGLIFLVAVGWCFFFMLSRRKAVPAGQVSDRLFTMSEKVQAWIICFLNPVWGGAIMYYGWRNRLPIMAKKANTISFITLGIWILVFVGFYFLAQGNS